MKVFAIGPIVGMPTHDHSDRTMSIRTHRGVSFFVILPWPLTHEKCGGRYRGLHVRVRFHQLESR